MSLREHLRNIPDAPLVTEEMEKSIRRALKNVFKKPKIIIQRIGIKEIKMLKQPKIRHRRKIRTPAPKLKSVTIRNLRRTNKIPEKVGNCEVPEFCEID